MLHRKCGKKKEYVRGKSEGFFSERKYCTEVTRDASKRELMKKMVFSMKYSRGAVRKSGRYRHRKRMPMIKRQKKEGVRNPGTD